MSTRTEDYHALNDRRNEIIYGGVWEGRSERSLSPEDRGEVEAIDARIKYMLYPHLVN